MWTQRPADSLFMMRPGMLSYDFMKFTAGESSYVIPLLAPLDSVLPDSYVQVSLQIPENTVMTAYQLPAERKEASDFYISFYGVNQDGTGRLVSV